MLTEAAAGVETDRLLVELQRVRTERATLRGNRLWAAMMLARKREVAVSILRGLPVRVGNLDPLVLNRALRGRPHEETYITVTAEMLDAIAEAGPIERLAKRVDEGASRAA
jgi:hypothetical protein